MAHPITRMEKTAGFGGLCMKQRRSHRQIWHRNTTSRENRRNLTTSSVAKASPRKPLKGNRFGADPPAARVLKLLGGERVRHRFGAAHANDIADLRRRIVDMNRVQVL